MNSITAVFVASLAAASAAPPSAAEVRLKRLPGAAYEVWGRFTVDASTATVWSVLTDYEGIPAFVSAMKSSRVREARADGALLVEQKAVGGMFGLERVATLLLEVRREKESLLFEDVGRESFWRYEGEWRVQATARGSTATYRLVAQPDFIVPPFVLGRVLRRGARELLDDVRAEIVRRSIQERK